MPNLLPSQSRKSSPEIDFCFQIKDEYDEREVEDLLDILERRGSRYKHLGEGLYRISVPVEILWTPFFQAAARCPSVEVVEDQCHLTGLT